MVVPFDQTESEDDVDNGTSCVVLADRDAFAEDVTLVEVAV